MVAARDAQRFVIERTLDDGDRRVDVDLVGAELVARRFVVPGDSRFAPHLNRDAGDADLVGVGQLDAASQRLARRVLVLLVDVVLQVDLELLHPRRHRVDRTSGDDRLREQEWTGRLVVQLAVGRWSSAGRLVVGVWSVSWSVSWS